jgi:hypothetical protein
MSERNVAIIVTLLAIVGGTAYIAAVRFQSCVV